MSLSFSRNLWAFALLIIALLFVSHVYCDDTTADDTAEGQFVDASDHHDTTEGSGDNTAPAGDDSSIPPAASNVDSGDLLEEQPQDEPVQEQEPEQEQLQEAVEEQDDSSSFEDRQLLLIFVGGSSISIDQDQAKNYVEPGWHIRDTLGNRIKDRERRIDVDYTLDRRMRNGEVGVYQVEYIASGQRGEEVARSIRTITVTDIDECDPSRPRHNCSEDATCINIPNSFQCKCNEGYEGDGVICVDIDECELGEGHHNCSPNAKCINTKGSFECQCFAGFRDAGKGRLVDGKDDCVDIDECEEQTHDCSVDGICTNTPGFYTCACKPGFEGDGRSCSPENLCAQFTKNDCHPKFAYCIPDEAGGYSCECRTGFEGDGRECTDIDECALGSATCPEHATCRNTEGSYECDCNAGFERQGPNCVDIDECAVHTDNCAPRDTAYCINTIGSFDCRCKEGFEGDGRECKDTSKPFLKLRGEDPLRMELYDSFSEPGYTIHEPSNHPDEVRVRVQYPPELDTYALACGEFTVIYTLLELRNGKKVEIDFVTRTVIVSRRDICSFDRRNDEELLRLIPHCDQFAKCVDLECGYNCECYEGYEKLNSQCVDRLPPVIELRPEVEPYPLIECKVCNSFTERIDLSQPIEQPAKIFAYDPLPNGERAAALLELERYEIDEVEPTKAIHHYKATDAAGNVRRRSIKVEVRSEDVRDRIEQMWTFLNENFDEFRKKVDENQRNTNRLSTVTYWVLGTIGLVVLVQILFLLVSKAMLLFNVLSSDRHVWSDFEEAWSFWLRIFHPMWTSAEITAEVFRKWNEKQ